MPNQQPKNLSEVIEEFEKTKFATGGGVAFECSDYEGMHVELKSFIRQVWSQALEYGASIIPPNEFLKVPTSKEDEEDELFNNARTEGENFGLGRARYALLEEAKKV